MACAAPRGRSSGKPGSREPAQCQWALVCARILAGQAFCLGLQNLPVIHRKEKVYGSIPQGGSQVMEFFRTCNRRASRPEVPPECPPDIAPLAPIMAVTRGITRAKQDW